MRVRHIKRRKQRMQRHAIETRKSDNYFVSISSFITSIREVSQALQAISKCFSKVVLSEVFIPSDANQSDAQVARP